MSDAPATLAAALAALQGDLPQIAKTQKVKVGTYEYKYATLDEVGKAILPRMAELGLSFIAKPALHDGQFVLAYSLLHVSGQREDGQYPLPASGNPQQIGSAITYGRRYCLAAVTGVAPEADDDGRLATPTEARPAARKRAAPRRQAEETGEQVTDKQLKMMGALMREAGLTDRDAALAHVAKVIGRTIQSRNDLTTREASLVIDDLMKESDR